MTTLQLPIHMRQAFDDAIEAFQIDGFTFDIESIEPSYKGDLFTVKIDCTTDEAFRLGVKVGYRLK